MKLKKAFNLAAKFELTWYPESNSSAQIKITKAQAKRDLKPCYEEYLLDEGDSVGVGYETLWYGSQGEIIASFDPSDKLLTLGA
jgi:hypothetical protein